MTWLIAFVDVGSSELLPPSDASLVRSLFLQLPLHGIAPPLEEPHEPPQIRFLGSSPGWELLSTCFTPSPCHTCARLSITSNLCMVPRCTPAWRTTSNWAFNPILTSGLTYIRPLRQTIRRVMSSVLVAATQKLECISFLGTSPNLFLARFCFEVKSF